MIVFVTLLLSQPFRASEIMGKRLTFDGMVFSTRCVEGCASFIYFPAWKCLSGDNDCPYYCSANKLNQHEIPKFIAKATLRSQFNDFQHLEWIMISGLDLTATISSAICRTITGM